MLARLRSLIAGKKNHSRAYRVAKSPFSSSRGRFETLEDRRMLSADEFSPVSLKETMSTSVWDRGLSGDAFGNIAVLTENTEPAYGGQPQRLYVYDASTESDKSFETNVGRVDNIATDGTWAVFANIENPGTVGFDQGHAYLANLNDETTIELPNDFHEEGDLFGADVDVRGSRTIVSRPGYDIGSNSLGGMIEVFDTSTAERIRTISNPDYNHSSGWRTLFGRSLAIVDSTRVLVAAPGEDPNGVDRSTIYLFNYVTGQKIWSLEKPNSSLEEFGRNIEVNDQGTLAAVYARGAGGIASIFIIDISTGNVLREIVEPNVSAPGGFGFNSIDFFDDLLIVLNCFTHSETFQRLG